MRITISRKLIVITLAGLITTPVAFAGFQIVDDNRAATPASMPVVRGPNPEADLQVKFIQLQGELARVERELDLARRDAAQARQALIAANAQLDLIQSKLKQVSVTFPFGNSEFVPHPDAVEKIEAYAKEATSINVRGYTDNVGSSATNKRIALQRANAAKSYLLAKGIAEAKIAITAELGKYVASNSTEGGRAANRRVEVEFVR